MPQAHQRITFDPPVLGGKPVIRGTRLSVEFVIGLLAGGGSEAEILRAYPDVAHEDVVACLAYARDMIRQDQIARDEQAERLASLQASIRQSVDDSVAGHVHDADDVFDRLEARYEAMAVAESG
ncbi:MAG: DUF433 domain-containing protein [Caulobacteraceae bacterium]